MVNLSMVKSAVRAIQSGMSTKNVISQLNDCGIYFWETIYPKEYGSYPAVMYLSLDPSEENQGRNTHSVVPSRKDLLRVLENEFFKYKIKTND